MNKMMILGIVGGMCISANALSTEITPGFSLKCSAVFTRQPTGEVSLVQKPGEYWLRYDTKRDAVCGSFRLFVFLDGKWRRGVPFEMPVATGKLYRVSATWTGREVQISVNGKRPAETSPTPVRGHCHGAPGRLHVGKKGFVNVTDVSIVNTPKVIPDFQHIDTRELMVYLGTPFTLEGKLENIGGASGEGHSLMAKGRNGVVVTPSRLPLASFAAGEIVSASWKVDAGTNGLAFVDFSVVDATGKRLSSMTKRISVMPAVEPDVSAKGFQPPVNPVRSFYVDSEGGDDKKDGLSPAAAWRTFANLANRTLGPGERLLLKRGSVFHDELRVQARGNAANWAEIGTYGEGMRPQIDLRRRLDTACARIGKAEHLVIRDLVVCNAGSGLLISCVGNVLVERVLAHHIEGMYRVNAHGIPEWRDKVAPDRRGIGFNGNDAHDLILRDCEMYQCTSGFGMNGISTFVHRVYCHDEYAHNTSPHPVHTAHRSYFTDSVLDAAGWQASAGTMGIMLARNEGLIIRGCHFLNQPDSGSPDEGGIDFENMGENVLLDRCTFRNNAGAAIEVLGLAKPQTRNIHIRNCRFDRNNWARKNGPAEIAVFGTSNTPPYVACSNGRIENNGFVLLPGMPAYANRTRTTNDWELVGNRTFDYSEELDEAMPYPDPPKVTACGEIWVDRPEAALFARVDDPKARIVWEQLEGLNGVTFAAPDSLRTKASFPGEGDYRIIVRADNGTLWRTARTAVHVLPRGTVTMRAWDFSRNLDTQGWRAEGTGTRFERFISQRNTHNTKALPVRLVCGDYYVIAIDNSADAAIVTPDETELGLAFGGGSAALRHANTVRVKMHNHTTSSRMRLWWQTDDEPQWLTKNSIAFSVTPQALDDEIYDIHMPPTPSIKQLKLSFAADQKPITGTVRIDYIWIGAR